MWLLLNWAKILGCFFVVVFSPVGKMAVCMHRQHRDVCSKLSSVTFVPTDCAILFMQLMTTMFNNMTSTFAWSSDLALFLNVINGTMILLLEDTAILRYCLASLINTCRHFKHVFATNGSADRLDIFRIVEVEIEGLRENGWLVLDAQSTVKVA